MIFEAAKGRPPEGNLHHKCENPWCVNPSHLKEVTQSAHMRGHGFGGDWGQANKTKCRNNHPYDEENTYRYVRKDGRVERHCRICVRAAKARLRERRRLE